MAFPSTAFLLVLWEEKWRMGIRWSEGEKLDERMTKGGERSKERGISTNSYDMQPFAAASDEFSDDSYENRLIYLLSVENRKDTDTI